MLRGAVAIAGFLALVFTCFLPTAARAEYPERSVTLVVTFPAGGRSDLTGRSLAQGLEQHLGVPVTVLNKVGAGGVIGAKHVARSKPDGYTIGLFSSSVVAAQYTVETGTNLNDYKVASLVEISPAAIGVKYDAPWKTLADLIASAKEKPTVLNLSTTLGGGNQVFAGGFLKMAGIQMTLVPFKGDAPSVIALAGGHVDVHAGVPASFKSLAKAKKVRILAVASDEPMPQLPEVPTFRDQGVDLTIGAFHAIYLPKDTPDWIVTKIEAALEKTMANENVIRKMTAVGLGPTFRDRSGAEVFLKEQDAIYRSLITDLGMLHPSKK